mgnify:CR=1 FL=1
MSGAAALREFRAAAAGSGARRLGFGPRLGLVFDLTQDQKTIFTAYYGRANEVSSLLYAAAILDGGARQSTWQYNNSTGRFDGFLNGAGGFQGQASDIQIHAMEILKIKQTLNERLAFHTGQPLDQIERDTDRDNFMSAEMAVEYGIVDAVLTKRD